MSETDHAVQDARAVIDRVQGRDTLPIYRAKRKRPTGALQRLAAIGAVNLILLVVAAAIGLAGIPIGMFGALAVIALMIAVTLGIALAPLSRPVSYEALVHTDLRALPNQTGRWLDAQRPALPAPARTIADQIGMRLDMLSPQLATLDQDTPAAIEVRKLVGEQLPEFVRGYQKVPAGLRNVPRNGKTPDAQLTDGLKLIDDQIAAMSAQLAEGDLDSLATRSRFLEIKYRGDDAA